MQATVKSDKLTRRQLQKLAKRHGVPANKKSDFIRAQLERKGVVFKTEDRRVPDADEEASTPPSPRGDGPASTPPSLPVADEVERYDNVDADDSVPEAVVQQKRGRASMEEASVLPASKRARSVTATSARIRVGRVRDGRVRDEGVRGNMYIT